MGLTAKVIFIFGLGMFWMYILHQLAVLFAQ